MTCSEARQRLWPPERPRLCEDDVQEARAHVDGCPECAAYLEQDRALLDVWRRLREVRAPEPTREAVFDAVARERARAPVRSRHRWLAVVVAVSGVAVSGWLAVRPSGEGVTLAAPVIEDHLRRAVASERIESTDPREIARFLTRELGRAVEPLRATGLRVHRAEICLLEGRRGAMIAYDLEGSSVSHYVLPAPGGRASAIRAVRGASGPTVIYWSTESMEHALVGDLSEEVLTELARSGRSD